MVDDNDHDKMNPEGAPSCALDIRPCDGRATRGFHKPMHPAGNTEIEIMTQLLEKAFSEASRLPEEEQNLLASRMLAEIESEQRWSELFAESQVELAKLARNTIAEHRGGKTELLDPEKL